ncbi:hypothetical protein ACLBOM_29295 [Escherichia coli]
MILISHCACWRCMWSITGLLAAPQNMAHKKRFASQVIKRFETGIEVFSQNAATAQRDALSGELAKLAQCWQSHNAPELAQATHDFFARTSVRLICAAPAPVPTPAASGKFTRPPPRLKAA